MNYVCGLCAGRRRVLDCVANDYLGSVVLWPEVGHKVLCPKCHGTGSVPEDRRFLQAAPAGNFKVRRSA